MTQLTFGLMPAPGPADDTIDAGIPPAHRPGGHHAPDQDHASPRLPGRGDRVDRRGRDAADQDQRADHAPAPLVGQLVEPDPGLTPAPHLHAIAVCRCGRRYDVGELDDGTPWGTWKACSMWALLALNACAARGHTDPEDTRA